MTDTPDTHLYVVADEPELDPDPAELDTGEPQPDTQPDWLVMATVCDCNYVAMCILHPDCIGTDASREPEGEHEAVACGADWYPLVAPLAITMAQRSGLPISAMCTSVYLPRADILNPTEQEHAAQQVIVSDVYRIVNAMALPSGVRVRGRYDFCGSRHPSKGAACTRGADHDGDHDGYTFRISESETWPATVDMDDEDELA